jgi:hypothetical protein
VIEPPARREHDEQRLLEVGIVEQLIARAPPARLERQQRRHFVVHRDAGRQAGLERERSEDPLRERVQRADRGVVELVERIRASLLHERGLVGVARVALELLANAVPQLGRGLLGKGDRGDAAHRHRPARTIGDHQLDDPVDQHRCFPGAGAGLDEQGLVETRPHRVARFVVGEPQHFRRGHAASPASTGSSSPIRSR